MFRSKRIAIAGLALAAAAFGCAKKPVTAPRAVVPETVAQEVRVVASEGKNFGSMVALGIGMSNGSPRTYTAAAERIYAVDERGNRIAPLSVEEAARQAGGVTALMAGLQGAGAGAFLTGLLGAIPGAIIGAAQGGAEGAGKGAAIGAGIGVAVGAIGGYQESKSKTEQEIVDQLHGLYFGEQKLKPGLPISGFVFYPAGRYTGVRAVLVDEETGTAFEAAGPMVPRP